MKRLLCPEVPRPGRKIPLNETEAVHATRVLRLSDGDLIEALDGSGKSVVARLRTRSGSVWLEYESEGALASDEKHLPSTVLEMAVLKGDAMEWVVEKAVELGITTLIPVLTAHTVVQMKQKGPEVFQERWQKIADQALKQCGRLNRMQIHLPVPLADLFLKYPARPETVRLWCDEASRENAAPLLKILLEPDLLKKEVRVLIGPEGGWSQNEREFLTTAHLKEASLGPLVLRAETAAIYCISLIFGAFHSSSPSHRNA
ncbi:MAG: hypothetical protein A2070_13330 [Bdellovibrionales bacterium GWC1_52_8]|nr:MAG: hypothetical protein A2Z97_01760 [Bdellovibrionales bacterium GWB1_52_6]OFZ04925.1 MAG: hypothetical protein A2X97_16310 [Bdellovibrionales bacterium GWA1_52_35]OFZ35653.1 MAG: hypothetical protein A2070_13330 [Bdellovibrionales bacterium GWC1_52_8]HCM38861.1 hypothetical protein [Bdellovibrionales bacterium]